MTDRAARRARRIALACACGWILAFAAVALFLALCAAAGSFRFAQIARP